MKVAIITLSAKINNNTGDVLQAKKTVEALRLKGIDVEHLLLNLPNIITNKDTFEDLSLEYINKNFDIIHTIPPISARYLKEIKIKLKPKLVTSTIFWRSNISTKVIFQSSGRLNFKSCIDDFLIKLGIRPILAYRKYDLLLPNSQTEIKQVKKYCRIKSKAKIIAVPNAIEPIPDWALNVKRFSFLPDEDYIVYPGIFAYRKNQLKFIRAMKASNIPIVFMGGIQNEDYFFKCKEEATDTMKFLGHIKHGSEEFYSCLKYARVACLASDCETPGIALLESASLGARPVITSEGGTIEYYSWDAEYLNPLSEESIYKAVLNAWERGRINENEQNKYRMLNWNKTAELTIKAYNQLFL